MSEAPAFERLLKRDRIITLAGLAALCALAWLYIVTGAGLGMSAWEMTTLALFPHQQAARHDAGMPGMDMGARTGRRLGVRHLGADDRHVVDHDDRHDDAERGADDPALRARPSPRAAQGQVQDKLAPTGAFAAGYMLVWLGFAVVAAALHWALERAGLSRR